MRSCRSSLGLVAVAAIVCAAVPAAAQETHQLDLVVGEQATIPMLPGVQVSEGEAGIIDLKAAEKDAKHWVLLALKPGTTTLLFITREGKEIHYTVTVRPRQPDDHVEARDNVRLDLYFVELESGGTLQLGLAWPGRIEASVGAEATIDLRTSRITEATALIAGEVLPRLDLAQAAGWAKVLRHASLVMTNGESGTFSSGGEVNVRVGNGLAVGLEQIAHGTKLTVLPRYDRGGGRIELQVAAEVATLGGPAADGLPGRKVTSVQTVVNVQLGEAVVLAGLEGEDASRASAGLPWLSQIPVLGYLFGSKTIEEQRVENVLVIVPTVVEAVDDRGRARVDEALRAFRGFEGRHPAGGLE
jgi:Flp pilus assembly secretin CpaC